MGIFAESLQWSYSLRLPDFTPIFQAELIAIILALRKIPQNDSLAVIVTDSLSVCTALTASSNSKILRTFCSMVPSYLRQVFLLWVPGHRGLHLNEMADSLARASLNGPVISVLPTSAYVTAARYRNFSISQNSAKSILTSSSDFHHLFFSRNNNWCTSRQLEVFITKWRCRIPPLNFYIHRCGLAVSPLCFLQ